MSSESPSSAKKLNLEKASNFMRQFRDPDSRELKKLSANQFMEVWSHYDGDGNGYIEGTELDGFLREFVSSANFTDISPDMKFLIPVLLLALAAVSSSSVLSDTRNNIMIGAIRPGDRVLRSTKLIMLPEPNVVQSEIFEFYGDRNTRISFISVLELGPRQFPTARILRGGVGTNNVVISIQSARGRGYNYSVQIFGQ